VVPLLIFCRRKVEFVRVFHPSFATRELEVSSFNRPSRVSSPQWCPVFLRSPQFQPGYVSLLFWISVAFSRVHCLRMCYVTPSSSNPPHFVLNSVGSYFSHTSLNCYLCPASLCVLSPFFSWCPLLCIPALCWP
jgi:hypothetical protein